MAQKRPESLDDLLEKIRSEKKALDQSLEDLVGFLYSCDEVNAGLQLEKTQQVFTRLKDLSNDYLKKAQLDFDEHLRTLNS